MIETLIAIPSACDVDYTNAESVCGYHLLLCKIIERAGGFDMPSKTNATIREVQRQGALWLKEVKPLKDDILSAPVDVKSLQGITLAASPSTATPSNSTSPSTNWRRQPILIFVVA